MATKRIRMPRDSDVRESELSAFIKICFACLEDLTVTNIAGISGLCTTTIYRLRNHQNEDITYLNSKIDTIERLGETAGLQLILDASGARVKTIKKRRRRA